MFTVPGAILMFKDELMKRVLIASITSTARNLANKRGTRGIAGHAHATSELARSQALVKEL
jgi:hypothetical protein